MIKTKYILILPVIVVVSSSCFSRYTPVVRFEHTEKYGVWCEKIRFYPRIKSDANREIIHANDSWNAVKGGEWIPPAISFKGNKNHE